MSSRAGGASVPLDTVLTFVTSAERPALVITLENLYEIPGALSRGPIFRWYSAATVVVVLVFGALAGALAAPMPGPTPWVGLVERVNIYASMAWLSVLGFACWPRTLLATDAGDGPIAAGIPRQPRTESPRDERARGHRAEGSSAAATRAAITRHSGE